VARGRTRRPLFFFGVAELLVGVAALTTPAALDVTTQLYATLHPALASTPRLLTAVRFACSLVVLLTPTVMMGASLPLLVRATLDGTASVGRRVGLLYSSNTAGAILGVLVTGYYLIGSVGIQQAFQIAAGINVTVGLSAIIASGLRRRTTASIDSSSSSHLPDPTSGLAAGSVEPRRRESELSTL
jgi:spermidine synthase